MTDQGINCKWHWRRGLAVSAGFLLLCLLHMALSMTANTSWEHHPFSGPLIVLHTARQPLQYVVGGLMWLVLGAGICLPAFRVTVGTVIACIASSVVWVSISMWTATVASC
jgi:hypothetical protein